MSTILHLTDLSQRRSAPISAVFREQLSSGYKFSQALSRVPRDIETESHSVRTVSKRRVLYRNLKVGTGVGLWQGVIIGDLSTRSGGTIPFERCTPLWSLDETLIRGEVLSSQHIFVPEPSCHCFQFRQCKKSVTLELAADKIEA